VKQFCLGRSWAAVSDTKKKKFRAMECDKSLSIFSSTSSQADNSSQHSSKKKKKKPSSYIHLNRGVNGKTKKE
jgi:hypothetical protein